MEPRQEDYWTYVEGIEKGFDHAMNVSKRIFGALQPAIQDIGGGTVNNAIMAGIGQYERGRDEIMGHHNKVQATLSHLRRAAPELVL